MDIFICFILKLIILENVYGKVSASRSGSRSCEMELFMAEVSSWKLFTIAVEGFALDVMWSLDSPLNEYLRFWNLINWPLLFEIFRRFWWHQQSIWHKYFPSFNKNLTLFQGISLLTILFIHLLGQVLNVIQLISFINLFFQSSCIFSWSILSRQ